MTKMHFKIICFIIINTLLLAQIPANIACSEEQQNNQTRLSSLSPETIISDNSLKKIFNDFAALQETIKAQTEQELNWKIKEIKGLTSKYSKVYFLISSFFPSVFLTVITIVFLSNIWHIALNWVDVLLKDHIVDWIYLLVKSIFSRVDLFYYINRLFDFLSYAPVFFAIIAVYWIYNWSLGEKILFFKKESAILVDGQGKRFEYLGPIIVAHGSFNEEGFHSIGENKTVSKIVNEISQENDIVNCLIGSCNQKGLPIGMPNIPVIRPLSTVLIPHIILWRIFKTLGWQQKLVLFSQNGWNMALPNGQDIELSKAIKTNLPIRQVIYDAYPFMNTSNVNEIFNPVATPEKLLIPPMKIFFPLSFYNQREHLQSI